MRGTTLPSAYAAGIRAFWNGSSDAGQHDAAARIAPAQSELATLPGNHAMSHHTPALLTGASSPVRAPATIEHGSLA